ncbi:MAG: tetratricopeptide repeat protein, partial [Pseudohongiella sp.]|nr:tetratricopeptide repeat protein [Pseudohongiella sp.]
KEFDDKRPREPADQAREMACLELVITCLHALNMGPQAERYVIRLASLQQKADMPDAALQTLQTGINNNLQGAGLFMQAGVVQQQQGRKADALRCFNRVLELDPFHAPAHNNAATLLHEKKDMKAAEHHYLRALTIKPDFLECLNNYAVFLQDNFRYADAVAGFKKVISLQATFKSARLNLGSALMGLGRYAEAELAYKEALSLEPDYTEARFNLGMCQLSQAKMLEGGLNYEARYDFDANRTKIKPPAYPFPRWQGQSLAGKRLLIWPEQGLGDQIMCVGFVRQLKQLAGLAHIVVVCSPALKSLFSRISFVDVVAVEADAIPWCDYWTCTMSLPYATAVFSAERYDNDAWIHADHTLIPVLDFPDYLNVGLCWKGSKTYTGDLKRSFSLSVYDPLRTLEQVKLYTLLPQTREEFLPWAGAVGVDIGHEIDAGVPPFEETAALISALDVVVTSDTSIAHLSAALGKPTFLVLQFAGEWRWAVHPTRDNGQLQVFQQTRADDWSEPVQRILMQLQRLFRSKHG